MVMWRQVYRDFSVLARKVQLNLFNARKLYSLQDLSSEKVEEEYRNIFEL
jgi:hypothetical protein